jgi:hypothetical protein
VAPISRILVRLARVGATAALSFCLLVIAAWLFTRLATDRYLWTQYLFWMPSAALVLTAAGLCTAGAILGRLAWCPRGCRGRRTPRVVRLLATITLIGTLAAALHLVALDYRLQNRLLAPAGGAGPSVRILNWNSSGVWSQEESLEAVLSTDPDIAIIVDSAMWPTTELHQQLPGRHLMRSGNAMILSRYPVLRAGMISLEIPSSGIEETPLDDIQAHGLIRRIPGLRNAVPPDGFGPRHDGGRAGYFEFDTREMLGRTLVVWLIDLPSDIRLHRRVMTRHARATIDRWEGQELYAAAGDMRTRAAGPGFPVPDVILGDFNIPRGSGSLRALTLGYPHAHAQAGWGHAGTYPRHRPLVHIDNMFVGPGLRALRYEIVDPGAGSHRMQQTEVVRRQ